MAQIKWWRKDDPLETLGAMAASASRSSSVYRVPSLWAGDSVAQWRRHSLTAAVQWALTIASGVGVGSARASGFEGAGRVKKRIQ